MEKEVLECTLRAENLYRKENVYLTEQEITCIRNSWRGMEGKEKRELIDLIFRLYDNYALNNEHESIGTTEIYTHIDRNMLRSEIIEHHPRNIKFREKDNKGSIF